MGTTKAKGGPLFQRQRASAAPTSDSFSGNQDTSIYILLETKDPGTTVKPLRQRGRVLQENEGRKMKAWRGEVT